MENKNNYKVTSVNNMLFYHCNDNSNNGLGKYLKLTGEEVDINTILQEPSEENIENLFTDNNSNVDLIEELNKFFKQYIYLSNEAEYTLVSLLTIHSYLVDLFDHTPYLWIQGEKGSGKTTLMTIMKSLVYNPEFLSETTPAALFRIIDSKSPTLFLDEVESLDKRNGGNQKIFQIMNSGYQRDGNVSRVEKNLTVDFKTYGFKVLAGINPIMSTLEDRCIHLNMEQPKENAVNLKIFSYRDQEITKVLSKSILSSLMKISPIIANYTPFQIGIDPKINLRELDKWYPILALAKSLTTETNGYFDQMQNYALALLSQKKVAQSSQPENSCKEILKDFLNDKSGETKINDPNYFFFETEVIQKIISKNDQHNTYRNKAEITLTLRKIGIETDRRRFGEGPVSLYKIPRSFLS